MQIHAASLDEMQLFMDWAAREGWNPGLTDAGPFHAADPEGFLIGEIDGQPVATISAVRYPDRFGFMGFYIVHPDWRGRGHGWAMWRAAVKRLEGCVIGLDGVLAEQDNYRRSGFTLAWRNIRLEGIAPPKPDADCGAVVLTSLPPQILSDFDRRYFPSRREAFLASWIAQPGTVGLGLRKGDALVACGVVRPCREGFKIGPLHAQSPELATDLLHQLLAALPAGARFNLDVPEPNAAALALARGAGMSPVFETARMYAGAPPAMETDGIYGVASFELG